MPCKDPEARKAYARDHARRYNERRRTLRQTRIASDPVYAATCSMRNKAYWHRRYLGLTPTQKQTLNLNKLVSTILRLGVEGYRKRERDRHHKNKESRNMQKKFSRSARKAKQTEELLTQFFNQLQAQ